GAGARAAGMAIAPNVAYPVCVPGALPGWLALAERMLELAAGDRSLGAGLGWTRPYGWAEMWRACLIMWSGRLAEARVAGERALLASQGDGDSENQLWTQCNLPQLAQIALRHPSLA